MLTVQCLFVVRFRDDKIWRDDPAMARASESENPPCPTYHAHLTPKCGEIREARTVFADRSPRRVVIARRDKGDHRGGVNSTTIMCPVVVVRFATNDAHCGDLPTPLRRGHADGARGGNKETIALGGPSTTETMPAFVIQVGEGRERVKMATI